MKQPKTVFVCQECGSQAPKWLGKCEDCGKWNTFEITAQGKRMIVTLNGSKMVDVEHAAHARGPIALQYGAGIVKFRNVQIKAM